MYVSMDDLRDDIHAEVLQVSSIAIDDFIDDDFEFTMAVRKILDRDFEQGFIPNIHSVLANMLIRFSEILYVSGKEVVEQYADELPESERIRFYDEQMDDFAMEVASYVGTYIEECCYQLDMYNRIKVCIERIGYCVEVGELFGIKTVVGDCQNLMSYDFSFHGLVSNGHSTIVDISNRRKGVGLLE